jgi:hypothetical protein
MENTTLSAAWGSGSIKDEEFLGKCKSLSEEQYNHIDNDRLVLYVVNCLEKSNLEPTFEKVVVAAFKLFPKRFSLLGFPEYPDAKTVYYPIMHCSYIKKGWLSGNMQSAFHLTSKGKDILQDVEEVLSGEILSKKIFPELPHRKERHFIDLLGSSLAFQKYSTGNADDISEMEIRIMLRTRTDTPSEVLKQNLEKYLEYVRVADQPKLVEFLEYIKKSPKWAHLFK